MNIPLQKYQKIKKCDDCGHREDGSFDLTYSCDYCYGRQSCEICGDELSEKGFVCPSCTLENRKCINTNYYCQNWKCRDCIGYIIWSQIDDKGNELKVMSDFDKMQENMYEKICNLKKSILII